MALPILDGNQSATTLSSVVTGGEHIVAHSVVSLGSTAISNITSAVSGVVVTIPPLAHLGNSVATDGVLDTTTNFIKIGGHQSGVNQTAHIVHVSNGGAMSVDASGSSVTFSQASVTFGAITGSTSILNFPTTQTVAGTVTANNLVINDYFSSALEEVGTDNATYAVRVSASDLVPLQTTVKNSVTIGSLPAISGTVTANANPANYFGTGDGAGWRGVVQQGIMDHQEGEGFTVRIAGTAEPALIGFVNINSCPTGGLTTRFGSVVTANLAQITSAVTNTSRKYLLAQNISAGTVTIGIGFSPTTTQGIQLPAGGGLTFDAFCPTGAVYWLGAVTGATWTILEG